MWACTRRSWSSGGPELGLATNRAAQNHVCPGYLAAGRRLQAPTECLDSVMVLIAALNSLHHGHMPDEAHLILCLVLFLRRDPPLALRNPPDAGQSLLLPFRICFHICLKGELDTILGGISWHGMTRIFLYTCHTTHPSFICRPPISAPWRPKPPRPDYLPMPPHSTW
jgi:hypothetical protein